MSDEQILISALVKILKSLGVDGRALREGARQEIARRKAKSKKAKSRKSHKSPPPEPQDSDVLYRVLALMDEADSRALQRCISEIQREGDIPDCPGNLLGRVLGELARSWLAYRELPIPKIYRDPDGTEHIIDAYSDPDDDDLDGELNP